MKIIIEPSTSPSVKKYIREISEPNGHDCWGNYEFSYYKGVYVDGEFEHISDAKYIAHDDNKPLYVGFIENLPKKMAMILDPKLKKEYKKQRYKDYLKLKKEFEDDTPENIEIKREVNIDKIII